VFGKPLIAHLSRSCQRQGAGIDDQDKEEDSGDDKEQHQVHRTLNVRRRFIISGAV
jgi:hypothetical protein